ncbi:hypothetical protein DdX_18456 [Ditylenchus destructor]|uniref:Uncharacterized protein n=1 Tax=Ditylenchus destructor TaxID=166010 RepID=A0AAD4QY54_9BILA|nr:hypothetical protein DdX_18456 [Ditylenchus destructor]
MRNSSVYSFDAVRLNVVPFQLTSSNCNFGFVFTATEMTQMFEAEKKVTGTLKAQPTVNNDDGQNVQNVKPDIYVQLQAKVMSSSIPADTKQEGLKVYFDRSVKKTHLELVRLHAKGQCAGMLTAPIKVDLQALLLGISRNRRAHNFGLQLDVYVRLHILHILPIL